MTTRNINTTPPPPPPPEDDPTPLGVPEAIGSATSSFHGLDNPGSGKNDDEEAPLLEMGVEIAATLNLVE